MRLSLHAPDFAAIQPGNTQILPLPASGAGTQEVDHRLGIGPEGVTQ